MHHDASLDALSTTFIKDTCKGQAGGQQALVCRKFMVACEAREHVHDSKQRHQVEGPIMQAKAGFCLPNRSTEPPATGFGKPVGKPRLPAKTEQIQNPN
jgi:hypothetical protein